MPALIAGNAVILKHAAQTLLVGESDSSAAVRQVDGRAELEASGGVDEQTVLVYATIEGLHYVSMGALTHSAPGLDLSLALEALPPK